MNLAIQLESLCESQKADNKSAPLEGIEPARGRTFVVLKQVLSTKELPIA